LKIDPDKAYGKRECPSCATWVTKNNNRCPICKYEFGTQPTWQAPLLLVIAIITILALLFYLF